uniref:Uncharacterized protein n=1 Tax=Avena sativa TaxID=4498 RepID=A0ACD5TP50_AVESA
MYHDSLPSDPSPVAIGEEGVRVQVEHLQKTVDNNAVVDDTHEENIDDDVVQHSPTVLQQPQESIAADRPRRNIVPPRRLIEECNLVHYALSCAEQVENDSEPATYNEAIASVDREKWVSAMQEEMQSLEKNGTWDVVRLPKQKKAVRCKWIFKKKEGLSPKEPSRYKARTGEGLVGYVDSDFAADLDKRRSLTGYVFNVGGCAVSWKATLQAVVAQSTTEAEYMAIAEACKESVWLKDQMFHERTKHIDVKYHFVRDIVAQGKLKHTEAGLLSQTIDAIGGGGDATGDDSIADLKAMLTGLVANKRFLLVVDDVWDGGVWKDVLRDPLEHGGRGSKVLITARHDNIAREMGAFHVHQVNRLSAADGWLLLRVATCVADGEIDASQLKGVGERLIDKCNGIPLAIDAVAGLLRTREASAGEWTEVLKSPAWLVKGLPDNAMTPLYMCYADLPCHLKQCFLYCSLFPPGFTVDRRVLVHKWIAERFVQARIGATVEEVAGEYYDELVGRNLLQTRTEEYAHPGRCTMHGMLHALAQLLLQGEGFTGDFQLLQSNDSDDVSLALRRVSLPGRNMAAIPERILKSDGIRTLLLPKNPLATASDILERMHHLRVLDLSETAIDLVPETLGNILHLRFLNLSGTRIQAVPVSIGNMRSLEFLLLTECKSLHALPKSIEHLTRLRDLDLAGTAISAGAFRVGQLGSLTSLRSFAVASKGARATQDRGHWPLAELRYLYQLRTLHVHKLEKAGGPAEAAEASLAGKRRLQELVLSCSSGTVNLLQTPTAATKIEAVFQELNPPEYLESLKIANYFGAKFPTWLSAILLPNLRRLDIIGCNIPLPPLGQLPELRSLCIADSSAPRFIDVEFMGTCNHHQVPFPKLDNLHLRGLLKLETWIEIEAGALPCLQAMQLESCPELRCLPGGLTHVTSLMELRIVDMASLKAVEDIAALRELSVWNTPNLNKISSMPSLEDLSISRCPVLQIVENMDTLQAVHIFDHQLQELPRWIKPLAAKLRSLDVTSTIKLLKRCLVDGPDWPLIKDIVQVHGLTNGSGYIYYTKSPYIFDSNLNAHQNNDMEGKTADSDNASAGNTNVAGFFNSKAVGKKPIRTEDNVTHRNTEMSVPRNSPCRMHKLAEVIPEDGEAEEDADSVVVFPAHPTNARAPVEKLNPIVTDDHIGNVDTVLLSKVTPHETCPDSITSVLKRQRSKIGKYTPTDAGTAGGTSVIKSATAVGHHLVREGSRAIQ